MDCGQIYKQINKYLISNPLNKYNYRQSWRLNSYEIAAKRTQPRNLSPTLTKSLEFIYPGYKQIRLTNRIYPRSNPSSIPLHLNQRQFLPHKQNRSSHKH